MNKSKTLLVLAIVLALVLVGVIGYTTYARYVGQRTGTAAVEVAAWAVKVDGTSIGAGTITPFTKTVAWDTNNNVVSGQIAPGTNGTVNFTIDPTGTEVALNYYVKVTAGAELNNSNIAISAVNVGETPLTMIPLGTCSNPEHTTEATCTDGEQWNASADKYAGYYTGMIGLPVSGAMGAEQIVTPTVTVTWNDLNTTEANTEDTATGITDASSNIGFDVVVEQKVA